MQTLTAVAKGRNIRWSLEWILITRDDPLWSQLPQELVRMVLDYFVATLYQCSCGRWMATNPAFINRTHVICSHGYRSVCRFVCLPDDECDCCGKYPLIKAFNRTYCRPCFDKVASRGWFIYIHLKRG